MNGEKPPALPTDEGHLADLILRHRDREEARMMVRRTAWLLAYYYFNGIRRFDVYNPMTGSVVPHRLGDGADRELQDQELLSIANQVTGRIQSMDVRPQMSSRSKTLAGQRRGAIAQIISDSITDDVSLRETMELFAWTLTSLGGCGFRQNVTDHKTFGLIAEPRVIHPRELMPFPSVGRDFSKSSGILWNRNIPVEQLEDIYGKRKISKRLSDMDWWEADPGESWQDIDSESDNTSGALFSSDRALGSGNASRTEGYSRVARVSELWVEGPRHTVERYVASCGRVILQDVDFDGLEVYKPVYYARFMNNGSWHGAGIFDLLFSIHRQAELLMKSLFNNVRDIDRYGVVVLPQGEFNKQHMMKDVGRGLRAVFWEPDPTHEGHRPFTIAPFNAGDMPGRVAQFAKEHLQSLNPLKDLAEEKGRADSAPALQIIEESINKGFTTMTLNVASAFKGSHRAALQSALSHIAASPRPIEVSEITLDLAGVVLEDNKVSFETNPLPTLKGLDVHIRQDSPRSKAVREQIALQKWQAGLFEGDLLAFKLWSFREGIELDLWDHEEKGAYEAAVRNVLTVFGDGETPGELVLTPETCRPELEIRIVSGFMTGPLMKEASVEVFNAFQMYVQTLNQFMGVVMPGQMPALGEAPPPGMDPPDPSLGMGSPSGPGQLALAGA